MDGPSEPSSEVAPACPTSMLASSEPRLSSPLLRTEPGRMAEEEEEVMVALDILLAFSAAAIP
eukprot:COSAG01_NODE_59756_length_298_cov_1.035176_1_plen_63_part_00